MSGRTTFLTAALAAAVFISAGAETPEEEIDRNIAKLGAEKYEDRLVAEAALREIGPEAALRYDPGIHGSDPEVHMRMADLMGAWEFSDLQELSASPARMRPSPWVELTGYSSERLADLDDDRVSDVLRSRAGNDATAWKLLLQLPRHPSVADIRQFLKQDAGRTIASLAARRRVRVDEATRSELVGLAERLATQRGEIAAASCVLLVRLGEPPDAAVAGLDEGRIDPDGLHSLQTWRRVCEAVGRRRDSSLDSVLTFCAAEHFEPYCQAQQADRMAQLSPDFAIAGLRKFLHSPAHRYRAAVWLHALGELAPGLDVPQAGDLVEFAPAILRFSDALERVAPLITGKSVEQKLRNLAERLTDPPAVAMAIRMLAARGRERDITFVYVKLKALPPAYQPDVAVALAKLGSAAGIGLLVTHLTGLDPETADASADAIRRITGRDFGFDAGDDLPTRCRAARAAARWWEENKRTFHPEADKIGK